MALIQPTGEVTLDVENTFTVQEMLYAVRIEAGEFNASLNPTLQQPGGQPGQLRAFATTASFRPYATTVGLYNDAGELLLTAKLAEPRRMPEQGSLTVQIRLTF